MRTLCASRSLRFVGTGEHALLVADLEQKLRVFKGTRQTSEHPLVDEPVAVCGFYMDEKKPRVPAVGVACGPHVFVYRNLRPYFKFTAPAVELDREELAIWKEAKEQSAGVEDRSRRIDARGRRSYALSARRRPPPLYEIPTESASLSERACVSLEQRSTHTPTSPRAPLVVVVVVVVVVAPFLSPSFHGSFRLGAFRMISLGLHRRLWRCARSSRRATTRAPNFRRDRWRFCPWRCPLLGTASVAQSVVLESWRTRAEL